MTEFLPLIGFVFFGLLSPGPNVILLTASGARFGFRRTVHPMQSAGSHSAQVKADRRIQNQSKAGIQSSRSAFVKV
ncbi:MAG: hypothetical protein AAF801_14490, partial [Pseudomonadota bacterium]